MQTMVEWAPGQGFRILRSVSLFLQVGQCPGLGQGRGVLFSLSGIRCAQQLELTVVCNPGSSRELNRDTGMLKAGSGSMRSAVARSHPRPKGSRTSTYDWMLRMTAPERTDRFVVPVPLLRHSSQTLDTREIRPEVPRARWAREHTAMLTYKGQAAWECTCC